VALILNRAAQTVNK